MGQLLSLVPPITEGEGCTDEENETTEVQNAIVGLKQLMENPKIALKLTEALNRVIAGIRGGLKETPGTLLKREIEKSLDEALPKIPRRLEAAYQLNKLTREQLAHVLEATINRDNPTPGTPHKVDWFDLEAKKKKLNQ